jgi:MFS family permease
VTAEPNLSSSGRSDSIFSPRYRITTLGILILMTIIAFEAMAVATALPTAARSLHGLAAYGWSFTGFLVASVVGMVASGMYSDQRGPRMPLLVGLALFIAGLALGGVANAMWVLVAARTVQGIAVGLLITAMYVVMGEVYADQIRPRIFAALASAWIVPGLIGPVISGWITEHLSWRWVFGGLAPFVALGGLMLVPSLRHLRTHTSHGALADPRRIGFAVLAAAGIAAVANVGEHQSAANIAIALVGVVGMVVGLRRLLPKGTVTFRAGVPAAVAFRGVLAGIFFGMEAIVPLTLTVQHHYSPTLSGMPLMLTAVSWAIGSNIQGRLKHANWPLLVATGLCLMGVAGVGMALVGSRAVPGWGAFIAWPIAGLGAGFGLTSASVALLEFTNDADRGSDSAALQLSDSLMSALCTSLSGAFVAAAAHGRISYGVGFATVYLAMAAVGVVAIARAARLRGAAISVGEVAMVQPSLGAP